MESKNIKQISVNIEERDYKESYQYFRLAVDNNINEAIDVILKIINPKF